MWVFGYGSLIWRADFTFLARRRARVRDWTRRFWQGSHDHRGVPDAPGRVVTLIAEAGQHCDGIAYLVEPDVFVHLDYREKNGYARHALAIELSDGVVEGLTYVAPLDNPAYLGPAPVGEIARQIIASAGPSGANLEYLLELARALREMSAHDRHIEEVEREVLAQLAKRAADGMESVSRSRP